MPTIVLTDFNIVTAVLGGFITLFGLVSYLLKERFYLSEARKFSGHGLPPHLTSRGDLFAGRRHVQSPRYQPHQASGICLG